MIMVVALREEEPCDGPCGCCDEAPENCDGEPLPHTAAGTVSRPGLPPPIALRIQNMRPFTHGGRFLL